MRWEVVAYLSARQQEQVKTKREARMSYQVEENIARSDDAFSRANDDLHSTRLKYKDINIADKTSAEGRSEIHFTKREATEVKEDSIEQIRVDKETGQHKDIDPKSERILSRQKRQFPIFGFLSFLMLMVNSVMLINENININNNNNNNKNNNNTNNNSINNILSINNLILTRL